MNAARETGWVKTSTQMQKNIESCRSRWSSLDILVEGELHRSNLIKEI